MSNPAFFFQMFFWGSLMVILGFPFIGPWVFVLILLSIVGGMIAHSIGQKNNRTQG